MKTKRVKTIVAMLIFASLLISAFSLTLAKAADASIWTDKADYSPEETVTIFGSGFLANAEVTVTVTRPDGSVNPPAWTVTSDESGNFETAYLLDGILGTYTVVATDGTNTATTTFTDATHVNTSTTLNAISGPLVAGQTYSFSGTVSANPTVPDSATVQLRYDTDIHGGYNSIGGTTTTSGGNGEFLGTFTAPSIGTYYFIAHFVSYNVGGGQGTTWDSSDSGYRGPITVSQGYQLTVNTNPTGVDSTTGSGTYASGAVVSISAPEYQDIVAGSSRYHFTGWSGTDIADTTAYSTTVTMGAAAKTVTANYQIQYNVHYYANVPVTLPADEWVLSGQPATRTFTSPQYNVAGDTKYVFVSDDRPGTITGPTTITATYDTYYKVTFGQAGLDSTATGIVVTVDSADKYYGDLSFSKWVKSGDPLSYAYYNPVLSSGGQFWLKSVTGTSTDVSHTFDHVTGPITETGNYLKLPFSAVTSSSLCPLTDNKFKLLFIQDMQNPNTYRLTASNPGQFYYNVFYIGTPEASYSFDITIPAPFVTQGAMPVHIYSGVSFIGGCYVPANEIGVLSTQITGTSGGTIHVEGEVPSTGLVYVAIHLDYGLKGIPPNYKPDASYNAYDTTLTTKLIPNGESYKFSYSGHETSVSNVNDFKKIPGFGGLIQSGGIAQVGVTVTVTIGSTTYSATTNSDGFYLINYKTGKAQSYTLSAGIYGSASGTIKANGFIVNSFIS